MRVRKAIPGRAGQMSAPWRLAWVALLLLGTATQVWAAAPRVPSWFPGQKLFSIGGSLVYEKYGKGSIYNAKQETISYTGQHWEFSAYPLPGQKWDWKKVYDVVAAGLQRQGYVRDYHNAGDSSEDASFHKGSGNGSWHIGISLNEDSSSDGMTIVQQTPLSTHLTLPPPAARPVQVDDKDNLPYLTPLPDWRLKATEHDDSPMLYYTAQGESISPFGGNITKRYDAPRGLSPLEFALVYETALAKAGWTLGQKIEDQGFVYAHYDKNGRDIYLYARKGEDIEFTVAEPPAQLSITLKAPAKTPERFSDKDPFPYLTPLPGWKLASTEHIDGPMVFYAANGDKAQLVGSGAISKTYLEGKPIANSQFERAYEQALVKAGWTLGQKIEEQGFLYAHYDRNGRDIWVYASHGEHPSFEVADVGSGLEAALAKGCKVAIYGVHFDFNKATLRPDAEPVLKQVLALFRKDPKLAVEIGGHTDNVGTPAYNQNLSERRATAVKAWLVAHGVAAARLTTHGYGQSEPLVANDTDAHRAKNRRVELKKPGCKH